MKRPEDFSKSQLKYVEVLEKKIESFSHHTTKITSYHAKKQFVDELNSLMINGIELPELDREGVPTGKTKVHKLLSPESLASKDDKIFDRIFKFMEKEPQFLELMDKLSEQISPEERDNENYASEYEEVQSHLNND
tara:strand:+ start:11378 stop:11785 length:408 start_codon:yes stop_codon:yes gene_type:complete